MTRHHIALLLFALFFLAFAVRPAQAQLNNTFEAIFDDFLREGFSLSPGPHGSHFLPAAEEASLALTPALNSLIASNISSFPLSSTVAGISFDFSTGQPVSITESLGPIFAETAETLGKSKLTVGFNATYLSLDKIRGLPLEGMRFTFLHDEVSGSTILGDVENESDLVDIYPNLDANATIFALAATYGITSTLDIGFAIPFVNVALAGTARAEVQSFTLGALGQANHHFGSNELRPQLTQEVDYDESASGIGDLAIRFKFRLPFESTVRTAALIDIRVPTGDESEFLGTGSTNVRASLIGSKKIGDFTPHINVGYDYRGADRDSDELELTLGFDQKLLPGLTFAADFIGEFDIQSSESIELLPGATTIIELNRQTQGRAERIVERSNIPEDDADSTINAAVGFRFAPTENLQFLANALIPVQDGGLQSSFVPTVGFSILF